MKKTAFALGLGFAAASSITGAQAQEGPYVGLAAGLHMAEGSRFDYEEPPGTKVGQTDVNYRLGYGIAGSIGYRWSDSLRLELELSHRSAGLDDAGGGTQAADGKQKSLSAMANVLFDVGVGQNFHPYIGAGVGIANNSWSNVQTPTSPVYDDSDKRLIWQAIVGLELPINARTHWFVDYRYIGSGDNQINTLPARARIVGLDMMSHNVMAGIRFSFGGSSPPVAAAPAQ